VDEDLENGARQKARSLIDLARMVTENRIDLES
jgi:3-methyladenine DNA glycosylase/8-oxoguanine DNA glycosylase